MTSYIITLSLVFSIAFLLGTMFASRNAAPIRTIADMNRDEADRAQARKTKAYIDSLWDVKL